MPWVRFTRDFDWTHPRMPQITTAYKAGMELMVVSPCAAMAEFKGAAIRISNPRKAANDAGVGPEAPADVPKTDPDR